VDRLPVFKALGDNTRYAIYLEMARSPVPLSTADIAAELGLHPNTVRPHLERMREAGLLSVEVDNRGTVGRPQHRYSLASDAPSLGLEPAAYPILAALLANLTALFGPEADTVAGIAREHGRQRGAARQSSEGCVAAVSAELAELGFDPASAQDGNVTTIVFTRCPFRPLAEAFPELVCHLHRGMIEGMVDVLGGAEITRFATLEDRDPCQVDLAV
jgi:predicted ArsR family transcriptional regulator